MLLVWNLVPMALQLCPHSLSVPKPPQGLHLSTIWLLEWLQPLCSQPKTGLTGSLLPSSRDESIPATSPCQPYVVVTVFFIEFCLLSQQLQGCFSSCRLSYKTQSHSSTTLHLTAPPEQGAAHPLNTFSFFSTTITKISQLHVSCPTLSGWPLEPHGANRALSLPP